MTISLNDSVVLRPDVIFRNLDDEAVLLDLKSGTYFGLDPVGSRIWQLMLERGSLAGVLEALKNDYAADHEVLERDLLELTRQLCDKELVEIRTTPSP